MTTSKRKPIRLLSRGNTKLGRSIFTFSTPAGSTCPGRSPTCEAHCYAEAGQFLLPSVQAAYRRNLRAAHRPDFVARVVSEIHSRDVRLLRIHVSGDYFADWYVRCWVEIARRCPATRLFSYTRSWRVPAIRPELEALAELENVRMWWSVDADTGQPVELPRRVRVAWMQTAADEQPAGAEVVFRVEELRGTVQKRVGLPLALVCPPENGVTGHRVTCEKCKVCWR
jgi:hypothetical protein